MVSSSIFSCCVEYHIINRCECGCCSLLPTYQECICCKEIDSIVSKIEEANDPSVVCITKHPGFESVCLNEWVLQAAYFQFRQEHGTTSAPSSMHE